MKIVMARLNHETNTFSPLPTPLAAFGAGDPHGPAFGGDAYQVARGSTTAMGAFIDMAERKGCELVTPLFAMANPSGTVDASAYRTMRDAIVATIAQGCDGILLDLHGAMVVEDEEDGEGALLERIREIAPSTPLAVALDLHGNISDRMIRHADIVVGFKTYPHVDMYDTGAHAARLLFDMLAGRIKPVVAIARPGILSQTLCQNTEIPGAMRDGVEFARELERHGALAATVFGGFYLADIADAGMSVVVVADRDAAKAQRWADDCSAMLAGRKGEFIFRETPLGESIARARAVKHGLTLLLDHGDNCMSGGTCDTIDVLAECLRQGLTHIGVGPLCDPEAVAQAISAGAGATVTLDVGNKIPMRNIAQRASAPLRLTGTVRAISNGEYTISGPIYTGTRCYMGRTILFDIGAARIVITEQTQEPWDLGVFSCVGLNPMHERYLILKSRMYYRPVFAPLATTIIECASVGVCSSDFSLFDYRRVRRPIYPLDA
ncbi:MAG: microcystin degradation protein MlrC [Betaproteobacteria bacterium]|nr:microcystin degradation protein MlrC [Betaproteobacteria bacterium]